MIDPCGARISLKMNIDKYIKRPLCPSCGRDSLKFDKAHHVRKRALKCNCDGAPFPHERGTVPMCNQRTTPPTEEEAREFMDKMQKASCGY